MVDSIDVVEYYLRNPCLRLRQIGEHFGITKQRVSFILEVNFIDVPKKKYHGRCNYCYRPLSQGQVLFCSRNCHHNYHYMELTCEVCGTKFARLESNVRFEVIQNGYNHFICGRTCYLKWFGHNFGGNHNPRKKKGVVV